MTQQAINPDELIKLDRNPDGSMNVRLERFGKVRISLPRSPLFIEVEVVRTGKGFVTQLTTGANGDEKLIEAAKKANDGKDPGFKYILAVDGKFKAA